MDETSLRVDKKNHWIHVHSAGDRTLKFLHRKRGKEAIEAIIEHCRDEIGDGPFMQTPAVIRALTPGRIEASREQLQGLISGWLGDFI